jgi:hypothetical protein
MGTALSSVPLTGQQRAWVLGAVALMVAECAFCTRYVLGHPRLLIMMPGCAIDCALVAGGTLWYLARRHGGLVALGLTRRRLLRLTTTAALLALALAARLLLRHSFAWAWLVAPLAELTTLALIALAMRRGLGTIVPQHVRDGLALELALWAGAWRLLRRRPLVEDDRFTTTRTSQLGRLIGALIVVIACEVPASHLLLRALGVSLLARTIILAVELYGIVWLLGDYQLMRESGHRLTADALELRLGARWRGRIPRAQIAAIEAPSSSSRKRALTPFDAPNVELRLHAPVRLTTYFGLSRELSSVRLYVDDPDRFKEALR